MWIHQHFRCAELIALQEDVKWLMERHSNLWGSPGYNPVHKEYMAKLPFVFPLPRKGSQIEITPFGEKETLYGSARICMWMFWVWMCAVLLQICHTFWGGVVLFVCSFVCSFVFMSCWSCGHKSANREFGHNLAETHLTLYLFPL